MTTLDLTKVTPADRVARLDAELSALDAQIRQAQAGAPDDGWPDAASRPVSPLDAAARALLEGVPVAPTPDVRELKERRAVLARARTLADAALARAEAEPLRARLADAHRGIDAGRTARSSNSARLSRSRPAADRWPMPSRPFVPNETACPLDCSRPGTCPRSAS